MQLTTVVVGAVIAVILVAFAYKAIKSHWLLDSGKPADTTPMDKDALIREIATSIVAVIITLGSLCLLAFVPTAPHDVITLALGAVLAFYFTNRQPGQPASKP